MANGDGDGVPTALDEAPNAFYSLERRLGRRAARTTRAREDSNAVRALGEAWFRTYRPQIVAVLGDLPAIESFERQLRDLLGRAGATFVIADLRRDLRMLARTLERQVLPAYEAARWSDAAQPAPQTQTEDSKQREDTPAFNVAIAERLDQISPDLGASYRQVHADLGQPDRLSFLGPAGEIREVMRAAIQLLSPDEEVTAQDWFVGHEGRPTQAERVRFILQQRDQSQRSPSEAAEIVDEKVGLFGRRLYGRASAAFHAGTQRDELGRIVAWVDAVLNEILP